MRLDKFVQAGAGGGTNFVTNERRPAEQQAERAEGLAGPAIEAEPVAMGGDQARLELKLGVDDVEQRPAVSSACTSR